MTTRLVRYNFACFFFFSGSIALAQTSSVVQYPRRQHRIASHLRHSLLPADMVRTQQIGQGRTRTIMFFPFQAAASRIIFLCAKKKRSPIHFVPSRRPQPIHDATRVLKLARHVPAQQHMVRPEPAIQHCVGQPESATQQHQPEPAIQCKRNHTRRARFHQGAARRPQHAVSAGFRQDLFGRLANLCVQCARSAADACATTDATTDSAACASTRAISAAVCTA